MRPTTRHERPLPAHRNDATRESSLASNQVCHHAKGLRVKRVLIISGMLVAIGAMSLAGYALWPRQDAYYSDADTIRLPEEAAIIREILWQPPIALPEAINTADDDYEPRLTHDGQTMFFVRGKPGSGADLYTSRRSPEGWSMPEPLSAINSPDDDLGPELSPDGKLLYFYSDRPGGLGGYDLWVSRLGPDGWLPPTSLGSHVNSQYNDYGPAISPDGKFLYFASNRPRDAVERAEPSDAWRATLREDPYRHDYDLYHAGISDAGLAIARPLAALNTPHNEGSPAFSPAGDFLYFASDRPGGLGGYDLYRSRRLLGEYEAPQNLGSSVNTSANELDPTLAWDGYALHFSSDRARQPTSSASTDARPNYNVYRTVSREVFREVEVRQARIDWAGIWDQIGPNILMALLALLLLALLLALLRDFKSRKLSLLARCLLASLMVHLLLMLLLNVVEVTTSLASAFRRSGRIEVSLASPAMAGELFQQVRGDLTSVNDISAHMPELQQAAASIDVSHQDALTQLAVDATALPMEESPKLPPEARESPAPAVELARTEPQTTNTPEMPVQLDAPPDIARLEAEESREEIVPLPSDIAIIERAKTPFPTTQPAADPPSVEIHPDSSSRLAMEAAHDSLLSEITTDAAPQPTELSMPLADQNIATTPPLAAIIVENLPTERQTPSAEPEDVSSPLASLPAAQSPPLSRADVATPTPAPGPALADLPLPPNADPASDSSLVHPQIESSIDSTAPAALLPNAAVADTPPPAASVSIEVAIPSEQSTLPTPDSAPTDSRITAAPDALSDPRADLTLSHERPTAQITNVSPEASTQTQLAAESLVDPVLNSGTEDSLPPATQHANISLLPPVELPSLASPAATHADFGLPTEIEAPAPVAASTAPVDGAIGLIRGRVTDDRSQQPLSGAKIQLDLPDDLTVIAVTDADGRYTLHAPQVPDHFALTAAKAGYLPKSLDVPADRLRGRTLEVDFSLQPASEFVIALEKDPIVHHLGNDLFEGRVNSQFQRQSEGTRFRITFDVSAEQLTPQFTRARVEMMAKGVQCPHQIRINGRRLTRRMVDSPADGSFGVFTAPFDAAILKPGENTLVIRNVPCRSDIDDFEFVNIQIRLLPDEVERGSESDN